MIHTRSKLSAQGQVSVPASVQRALGLGPGAVLEWVEEHGRIVVQRAARHSSQNVRDALFPPAETLTKPISLDDLKQGIRRHVQHRHASD